ncbi:copper chaperone PCu(A)C [Streptomyces sp. ISL-44]|uniref:copper chaperone PCu(A)C n=1 Tax=unclassified Streptomyces TaxID=2593676 RepID=UPI001BE59FC4|nr:MULTISPECIES: copper chaperone PCu(A)C [unclassified Streptomyces]MBT2539470.1 copper chaperone PCu(A)C [Streptomyces sp. ISL-44]MCX5012797.1 copper chaperone PCu(A)C [Streptomyces sp. NBC_00555]
MNARTTRTLAAALSLTAALAISGCSGSSGSSGSKDDASKPAPTVGDAFMPQPVNDKMAGAFMVIKNDSKTADKLTGVTSTLSDDLQIHETKDQKMQQVQSLDVPANGELKLERGGTHIMFMGLKSTPKVGDKVTVELRFEKADPVKVELDVKERTYTGQAPTSTAGNAH